MDGTASLEARTGRDLRVLDGVASWCGGLHGSMSLPNALKALACGLDADAAAISRHYHRNEPRPRGVALFDSDAGGDVDAVGLRRGFCQDVLGYLFGRARSGTVWFLSDVLDDPDWSATEALRYWRAARDIDEIVVIPLHVSPQSVDYIEFHYVNALERSTRLELEALAPTIVRSWLGRKPGLVTQASMDDRLVQARSAARVRKPDWDAPLLGMSNPANLSRAEFRVCLLLSRGLSVSGVAGELGLSENTVRSHLRAIYSKTETSNLAELLYRILSAGREDEALSVGTAGR